MIFIIYFNKKNSHQHVSADIPAIFRLMFLLQDYKNITVANRVAVTP